MLPHLLHLLQPLDVACFSPLKQAYSGLVQQLARKGIFHLDKTDFIANYQTARLETHYEQNAISKYYSLCQKHGGPPGRFMLTLKDGVEFNFNILVYIMYVRQYSRCIHR